MRDHFGTLALQLFSPPFCVLTVDPRYDPVCDQPSHSKDTQLSSPAVKFVALPAVVTRVSRGFAGEVCVYWPWCAAGAARDSRPFPCFAFSHVCLATDPYANQQRQKH